jgi:phosphate transport system permease protein
MNSGKQSKTEKLKQTKLPAPIGLVFEKPFRHLTYISALLLILTMAAIFIVLIYESIPVFTRFGISFLTSANWNPVTDDYGALAPILGTVITSLIAIIFGVPLALGCAFFFNEKCPFVLRSPLSLLIELLAAIPSIIYGMWGLFVLVPIMSSIVQPFLINTFGAIPLFGVLFQGPPFGIGVFTAGLILSIMILPYISAVALQAFAIVPPQLREAAYGTGATIWEVCSKIIVPFTRQSIIGAIMLGLGRALGETMAVTFVIGNAHNINQSILAPGTTISATLANEFAEAFGQIYTASLLALGLILFLITFSVLIFTRILLYSTKKRIPV